MSWKASGYVKELRDGLIITEKFVLLILAEYHRTDEKMAWPSVATLAEDCLMTERGVRQILNRLVEKDFIRRTQTGGGRGNVAAYQIVGLDTEKGELDSLNAKTVNGHSVNGKMKKGERNPAQPTSRNKEEPVFEPIEQPDPAISPPSSENSFHQEAKKLVQDCYKYLNKTACPWDGSEAKQLSSLKKAKPDLTLGQLRQALWNYAQSDINPSDRPRVFIPKLFKYLNGPIDRFGMPKNGHGPASSGPVTESPSLIERLRAQTGRSV